MQECSEVQISIVETVANLAKRRKNDLYKIISPVF